MADDEVEMEVSGNGRGYMVDGFRFADRVSMERYMTMRKGGGINLEMIASVGGAVSKVFEGMNLDRRVEKIRDARWDLRRARNEEYAILKKVEDGTGIGGLVNAARVRDEAQDRLDRNQTLALAEQVDAAYLAAGVDGVRALGAYQKGGGYDGGGAGGGGDAMATGVIGAGVGFVLGKAWDDDDDDDDDRPRRRRR